MIDMRRIQPIAHPYRTYQEMQMNTASTPARKYKAPRHDEGTAFLPARYAAILIAAVAIILALGLLAQA